MGRLGLGPSDSPAAPAGERDHAHHRLTMLSLSFAQLLTALLHTLLTEWLCRTDAWTKRKMVHNPHAVFPFNMASGQLAFWAYRLVAYYTVRRSFYRTGFHKAQELTRRLQGRTSLKSGGGSGSQRSRAQTLCPG